MDIMKIIGASSIAVPFAIYAKMRINDALERYRVISSFSKVNDQELLEIFYNNTMFNKYRTKLFNLNVSSNFDRCVTFATYKGTLPTLIFLKDEFLYNNFIKYHMDRTNDEEYFTFHPKKESRVIKFFFKDMPVYALLDIDRNPNYSFVIRREVNNKEEVKIINLKDIKDDVLYKGKEFKYGMTTVSITYFWHTPFDNFNHELPMYMPIQTRFEADCGITRVQMIWSTFDILAHFLFGFCYRGPGDKWYYYPDDVPERQKPSFYVCRKKRLSFSTFRRALKSVQKETNKSFYSTPDEFATHLIFDNDPLKGGVFYDGGLITAEYNKDIFKEGIEIAKKVIKNNEDFDDVLKYHYTQDGIDKIYDVTGLSPATEKDLKEDFPDFYKALTNESISVRRANYVENASGI